MTTKTVSELISTVTPEEFLSQMVEQKIHRAFLVYANGELKLSHPDFLSPIRDFLLESSSDFAHHEAIFIGRDDGIDTLFFAFVHDTHRGLSQGGLRFWKYETINELLTDDCVCRKV